MDMSLKSVNVDVNHKEINRTLNIIKCFAILCVIVIHCQVVQTGKIGLIIDALTRVAVPIFFMISGYYSVIEDDNKAMQKCKARIIKTLKLIILSSAIYFIYYYITGPARDIGKWMTDRFTIKKIYTYIFLNESPFGGHLWFLNALLLCYILLYFFKKYNLNIKHLYRFIPTLLLCNITIGELAAYNNLKISYMCYRNFIFMGLPFYLIGYYIKDIMIEKISKISNKKLLIIVIIECLMTAVEVLAVNKLEMYIGTILTSIGIFLFAVKNPNMLKSKPLEFIGGKLYTWIYIIHVLIIYLIKDYEEKIGLKNNKIPYINVVIAFGISVIFAVIIYGIKVMYRKIKKKL